MFKTIFSKMIAVFIIILVIAFSVTGFLLSFFLDDYFTKESSQLLEASSTEVYRVFTAYIENINYTNSFSNIILESFLKNSLSALGNYTNSIIWIVDETGHIFLSNIEFSQSIYEKYNDNGYIKIPDNKKFQRLTGEAGTETDVGDYSGFFKDTMFARTGDLWLTVGRSFRYMDASGANEHMIIVYMHTPVKELKETRIAVFKYFLISVAAAIITSFVFIYFFSHRFTKPLKLMKNAAAKISSGDFQRRLDIKSRDEIGELASAFNQMAVELQNIEEMRRGFIANVSHELRTPMTSIRGFVEGILDGTIPPEKQSQYLIIVRDEAKRLNRLVNDLLDLAKMEAGEISLNIKTLDINELIRKCIIKLEALLLEKNLTVDADFEEEHILVSADEDAIERVLYNLLHNAVKFTPAGGKIKVMTHILKDKVKVTIDDTGIGIDENELNMIWERFYKTDKSRSRDKTGTGLGLAIVRNIINEHGQKIWVKSESGAGTSFAFTLARAYEEPQA